MKNKKMLWLSLLIASMVLIVLGIVGIVIFSQKISYAPLIISAVISIGGFILLPFAFDKFIKHKKDTLA